MIWLDHVDNWFGLGKVGICIFFVLRLRFILSLGYS